MRLIHLTAVGPDHPAASLNFAPRLTVIYGASETGKSYIIDALDFMFGGQSLRDIPQAKPYRTMLLGLELADGTAVTLARAVRGGKIYVYEEDLRTLPDRVPDRTLLAQHNKVNDENISHFLLSDLGIAGAQLRKNQRNVLQTMGLRNLAHLCLIDETRVQAKTSPVESGIPTARTAERSALKLLLEGVDDSGLTTGEDPVQFRRVNRGQVEVLDRVMLQLREQIGTAPERQSLLEQLARVNIAISAASASIEEGLAKRDSLTARREQVQAKSRSLRGALSDTQTLISRFSLLDQQYASDLERLNMVQEAGTFLGYFNSSVCMFCGADPQHHNSAHAVYETTALSKSVDAEVSKTQALKQDLAQTIGGLVNDRMRDETALEGLSAELTLVGTSIHNLESDLQPARDDMKLLLDQRSKLERLIGLWDRIGDLTTLTAAVAQETPTKTDPVADGVSSATQDDFSRTLNSVLTAWQVPGAKDATFTFEGSPDVMLGQRRRAGRGKGMRSVLHAGFTIALSEYCLEHELPHPGFVALDTPVLTYRDAEKDGVPDQDDELVSQSVADAFYEYISTRHTGQVIVLENQTPPSVTGEGCSIVYFSGTPGANRSGFYPE
ncbi:hypothetical protein NIBR502772_02590 [Pseudarthrobacter sp. NIBRBAC000502772]|uniref:AAA family ATPase n=1 Tax=Pseudarthrobacter sp. NIBRBAC000502772 TaxID=2590775 RepID=UPI00112FD57A|nr:AAA family ATPase [Pseudarthrobacter sp. NIBRBAC000502772]QDG65246.1 hypothetical protein NIBR502772_02590 [Pseudarthrobacter sp. NIBRBAC000502772]